MPLADHLDEILDGYKVCAVWTATNGERQLDETHSAGDIEPESLARMRADCQAFVTANEALLGDMEPEQVGHDLWLTRNGHGTGFWDRGLGERGDKLADAARAMGESNLYIGDDDKVYLE